MRKLLMLLLVGWTFCYAGTYKSPIEFTKDHITEWANLEAHMELDKDKVITIYWSGEGGDVSFGDQFIDLMEKLKRKGHILNFIILTQAISEHAFVACHASHISYYDNGSEIIFHDAVYSYSTRKLHKKVYVGDKNIFQYCVNAGLLTNFDVNVVVDLHKRVEIHKDGSKNYLDDWTY